ncbi:Signal transduction histidine kinase [Candidatus Terasakiella magnetica]|nr:Signal transduction histidine kinase [Candidatus Terasakiella magnetica]
MIKPRPRILLARQLMARMGVAGAVIVMLATSGVVAFDYHLVKERAVERLDQIESGHLPSIVENTWLQDRDRLAALTLGIKSMPYTILAEVVDSDGTVLAHSGDQRGDETIDRSFPLIRSYLGHQQSIGHLRVSISLDEIRHPVLERAWGILMASLAIVGALLVTLYGMVAPLVTRPLSEMAAYARSLTGTDLIGAPALERPSAAANDEFSDLAAAFSDMLEAIRASYLALQESEARHRMLFTSSPISLWEEDFSAVKTALDRLRSEIGGDLESYLTLYPGRVGDFAAQVRVIDINTATVILHRANDRTELLGALDRTFSPASLIAFRRQLLAIWHGENELSLESQVKTLDGEMRDVVVHWVVPPGHGDRLDRVIVALEDVTERRAAEHTLALTVEKMVQANSELERFTYIASHDLQEPVRGIVSFSQLLQRHLHGHIDAETEDFLHFLVAAALRMQQQVQGLQGYARAGFSNHIFQPVSMDIALDQARTAMAESIAETGAQVEAPPLPMVSGDLAQLTELFQHLIGNAIKFARSGVAPHIRISAQPGDGFISFAIEDNGIGIDPAYAGEIFQMFRRLHGPDRYPGAGVGLAICRRIIERHGGRIWIDPPPVVGARLCFTLPSVAPPPPRRHNAAHALTGEGARSEGQDQQ